MDRVERTALVSVGINVGLVALKVVLAFLSGSLALLADAWHSGSDIVASGVVWVGAPKGEPMFAVKAGGSGRLTADDNAWLDKKNSPDACTPAVYKGRFYILDGRLKVILCKDPKTGRTFWKGKLGGLRAFQASPTAADGKIYCMRLDGEVVILAAGDEFKVLNRIRMGGKNCQATIVPAGGQLFVRVDDALYCIGRRGT